MAFRNRVTELSQLIADEIIGAVIRTAAPPKARVEIRQFDLPNSLDWGAIFFYKLNDDVQAHAGQIFVASDALAIHSPSTDTTIESSIVMSDSASLITPGAIDVNGRTRFEDGITLGFGGIGSRINMLDWGDDNGVVAGGTGRISFPHNLQTTPKAVIWMDHAGNAPYIGRWDQGSSGGVNFVIQFRDSTTNTPAPNLQALTGAWVAIA